MARKEGSSFSSDFFPPYLGIKLSKVKFATPCLGDDQLQWSFQDSCKDILASSKHFFVCQFTWQSMKCFPFRFCLFKTTYVDTWFYNCITASMQCLLIVPDKLQFSKPTWVGKHGMLNYLHLSASTTVRKL